MNNLRIIIADDSNELLKSMTKFVENQNGMEVTYTCNDGTYLLNYLRNNKGDILLEQYLPFIGLIIFGNIENLILASQGVVAGVDSKVLAVLSIIIVILWLIIGTVATDVAMQYANVITFIGGLAIFILGVQAVVEAVKNIRASRGGK